MPEAPSAESFERARESFLAGLGCLEARQFEEAERHFLAALERVPGRVSVLVNLAATRLLLRRPELALAAANDVLAIEPDNRDAWLHRATALGSLSRHDEALAGFERVLASGDGEAEIWSRQAQTLSALNRHDDARHSYERALAIDPTRAEIWSRYGELLREQKRLADAAVAFENAIAHGADPELHRYLLASVSGSAAPPTAPSRYVRALFDGYAREFDQHLVGLLGYQAHLVLTRHLARLVHGPFESALDLGCGTGLCGPLLRPRVLHLTGVDLSGPMLAQARALGVYDELRTADLTEHLQQTRRRHDLVLAADVFIYVGELTPVFAAVRKATRAGAVFCFTAEIPTDPAREMQLLPSLRYAHSEAYLRRLAARHGFDVLEILRLPVREDQRQPIEALYVYLVRQPGHSDP